MTSSTPSEPVVLDARRLLGFSILATEAAEAQPLASAEMLEAWHNKIGETPPDPPTG